MTTRHPDTHRFPLIWLAVALALIAALAYVLIGLKVLAVGDLRPAEGPPSVVYFAAGSYLIGGLLILLRNRWLWVVGAVINAFVILFFFTLYQDRPVVMFSTGALASKAAQVLLEVILVYLIINDWLRSRRSE